MVIFHLNHVGYKGYSLDEFIQQAYDFHLNHVGYKDEADVSSLSF